ncbi:Mob1/phocein [Sparassis latifolia]|uniref:Maintenance of ploidy protein n=1 Tax=Sparassis crispa TaxID=139825 RepID=A0A401GLJ0_9APHY|nr:Maintenance of ploidy protein [Sparassis crispa]GBE83048.1 Maintenance of ploidy protein [Sparassis crispa]
MSFFNSIGRSMTRAPRPPRRSTTPTSSSFPSNENLPGAVVTHTSVPRPLYLSSPFVDAALVKGNFKHIVMLPKYADVMEWVAVNIFDFYQNLNQFYGVLAECCTQQSCPTMAAGPTLSYTWVNQDRKSVQLPAPTYIDYVMTWVQNSLDDETVFPTKSGREFSQNFPSTVKHIYRQLLRVFAHLYHAHYPQILHLRSEPHFNSLFAHFLAFGKEYELLDIKDVKGQSNSPVGVGALLEKWKEMGILES